MIASLWNKYKNAINGLAQALFHQEKLIWMRLIENMDVNAEGINKVFEPIELNCLVGYNDFRVWPMDKETASGAIDTQNMYIILNKKYLSDLGYLNEHEYFAFKPGKDYFILRGINYQDSGDTDVAQAAEEPLLFFLILKRMESLTGEPLFQGI